MKKTKGEERSGARIEKKIKKKKPTKWSESTSKKKGERGGKTSVGRCKDDCGFGVWGKKKKKLKLQQTSIKNRNSRGPGSARTRKGDE